MEHNEELKNDLHMCGQTKGFADVESKDGRWRYKIGIIDFLTNYDTFKFLENQLKSKLGNVDSK